MDKKTIIEVERFHDWLVKLGNIYLADFDKTERAYQIIAKNCEKNLVDKKKVLILSKFSTINK